MNLKPGFLERLLKASKPQQEFMEALMMNFEGEVTQLQSQLFKLLIKEWASKLDVKDGKVVMSVRNMIAARELEVTFDMFNELFYTDYLNKVATNFLEFVPLSVEYYKGVGVSQSVLSNIHGKVTGIVAARIGVQLKDGQFNGLLSGGYLDKLLQSEEVRIKAANLVVNSIATREDYKTFLTKFTDFITGTEEKDGAMLKYLRGYVYDTYSQVQATASQTFAEYCGIDTYYYHGSIIETSREFCIEHENELITQEDIEFFDTIEWKGKNYEVPFVIGRGGYNCRHFLDAVPKEALE